MRGMMQIEPLYHQTVKGNKDQTRRTGGLEEINENPDNWYFVEYFKMMNKKSLVNYRLAEFRSKEADNVFMQVKPHYRVGEVLYLKEPTAIKTTFPAGWAEGEPNTHEIEYRYDHSYDDDRIKWKNKMFMPASAARVFLQITGIRCERLLDISDEDCIAEGIENEPLCSVRGYRNYIPPFNFFENPKKSYLSLYRFANKLSAKKDIGNPWVWVYTYKLIDKP